MPRRTEKSESKEFRAGLKRGFILGIVVLAASRLYVPHPTGVLTYDFLIHDAAVLADITIFLFQAFAVFFLIRTILQSKEYSFSPKITGFMYGFTVTFDAFYMAVSLIFGLIPLWFIPLPL